MFTDRTLFLILLFPLLGSLVTFFVGKKVPALAGWIATFASFCSFLVVGGLYLGFHPEHPPEAQTLGTWFSVADLDVNFSLKLDSLSLVMCLVVTGIGTLIHLYSISYMDEDPSKHRFFSYLNLFMFSMLTLVLGQNMLVMFVGWEGVGLCSYLLIGFWFTNLDYAAAGRKAFVVNRIGDAGFLIAIFLLSQKFSTIDFTELGMAIQQNPELVSFYTLTSLCLFVGATGKSAQIPLFVWLPDAMAGPTPVSALIHAATMVTAGIYMLARMHFLFALAPMTGAVIVCVGGATAFVAATIAMTQNDIKKVLAYSTVSQLGFMFLAAGAGAYWVALFHVVTHAFFKACLFLGAGSVIHGCHHEQDMRHMGGLSKLMPITAITYLISVLAIAGIAPLAGYYSKHAILESLHAAHFIGPAAGEVVRLTVATVTGLWGYVPKPEFGQGLGYTVYHAVTILADITAFLTAFYMTRSFALTFLGSYRGHAHPHESPWKMVAPLVVLSVLALGGGWYLAVALPEFLHGSIPVPEHPHRDDFASAIVHSWVGILGVGSALILYTGMKEVPGKIYAATGAVGRFLTDKWRIDELYRLTIVGPLEGLARFFFGSIDQWLIDGAVNGTASVVDVHGEMLRTPQTGQVSHYALFMFLGSLVIILLWFVW